MSLWDYRSNADLFTPDATTLASSNGTQKVRRMILVQSYVKHGYERLTSAVEFLRGTAKNDECEPLFKQYKECLGVSMSMPVFATRRRHSLR